MESFVLPPGSVLKDRYCLQRIIDQDGTVVEYLAQDCANGARYRVRHVHVVYTDPGTFASIGKVSETAPQLIGLHHRALAAVVDCFDQGPDFFTVSAWVDGPSLAATAVPVATEVAVRWMMDILEAMEIVASHSDRIGLPESSPQTIRVRDNGTIVIGCLRCLDDGTPQSSSPSPFHSGELQRSFKSDVYTLGALTWWLLTGQPPPTMAERKRADRALAPPAQVPAALGRGLLRMMSMDPRRRPATPSQARQFFLQSGAAPKVRRLRPRAIQWPLIVGAATTLGALALSPLIHEQIDQFRDRRHAHSLEAMLDLAGTEVKHGAWRNVTIDFAWARQAGAVQLTPDDTLNLAEAERRCWHPDQAREALDTTTPGVVGAGWWLELGKIEADLGQPTDTSWQRAAAAIDDEPSSGLAQLHAGELALQEHQNMTAERALRQAVSDQQTVIPAMIALGGLFRQQGDYAAATEELQRARQLDPEAVEATVELGHTQLDSGLFSDAMVTFSDALHHGLGCDEAWFGLGQAALAAGQREDALGLFEAVRRNPANGEELAALGHTLALTGRVQYAQQAWDLASGSLQEVHSHPEAAAQIQLDQGQAEMAVHTLEQSQSDDPCTLYLQAEAAVEAHQPASADVTVNRLYQQPEGALLSSYDAGMIHMQLGQLADAHSELAVALQKRPTESAFLVAMGECLVRAGSYSEGTRYLAKATMDHPTCSDALRDLAQAEEHLKQFELSALHLQKLCDLDDRVENWQAAGERWMEARRWDKATRCYLIGRRHHPEEARFDFWLANCFEALGRLGEATFNYRSFLRQSPYGALADEARLRLRSVHERLAVLSHLHHVRMKPAANNGPRAPRRNSTRR